MEQALLNNELFRFIVQVVVIALGIAGAYYKIQNNIAILNVNLSAIKDRVEEIEKDRVKKWCAYDAVSGDHGRILAKMSTDIEVIKTKIEIYLKRQ
jgi:hypothetical protein